jgi:hypothetical protein
MGIRDKPTAPASPWQNGFAERLIGSIRRECVDHIIVLGEMHLRRVLKSYADYYNCVRTHRSLNKDAPVTRQIQRIGSIRSHAILGGLHHRYAALKFSVHTGPPPCGGAGPSILVVVLDIAAVHDVFVSHYASDEEDTASQDSQRENKDQRATIEESSAPEFIDGSRRYRDGSFPLTLSPRCRPALEFSLYCLARKVRETAASAARRSLEVR